MCDCFGDCEIYVQHRRRAAVFHAHRILHDFDPIALSNQNIWNYGAD